MIKHIDVKLCAACPARSDIGCPAVESCPIDVLRYDTDNFPCIAYQQDCTSCYLCELDCASGAIKVTPEIMIPVLPY